MKLINILAVSTDNYMLILQIKNMYESLQKIENNEKYLINTDIDGNGYCYISNINCSICGYTEHWLMKCGNCK